jgi:hypothetical protein
VGGCLPDIAWVRLPFGSGLADQSINPGIDVMGQRNSAGRASGHSWSFIYRLDYLQEQIYWRNAG